MVLSGWPTMLAFFLQPDSGGSLIHPPSDFATNFQLFLRWSHFVAGIAWIGILYFFNVVNVPLMKALDAPTKGKVIPEMMPRALWYFRWGAVVTVLVGITYYAMYMLAPDANNAGFSTWRALGKWFLVVLVGWAIIYALITRLEWPVGKGARLAVIIAVVVVLMSWLILYLLGTRYGGAFGNKSLSIGLGGGYGIIMLLNVWGIIWPAQKRIIAWTKENAEKGTAIPSESATLGRRAFLASRTNAWLSLLMLLFMATSTHYPLFGK